MIGFVLVLLSTGANQRNVPETSQDVKTFGAKGNGTNDDTSAIQAAINNLGANGGAVVFPAGVYKTTATLTVPEKVTLKGTGMRSSVISFSGAGYAIALGSASAKSMVYGTGVADMGVVLTNATSNGITLQTTAGAVVMNVYLEGLIPNSSTAVFVDGGNVANQFTALTNIVANHVKYGFRLGTSGAGTVTSVVATNINSFGDTIHGVKDSVGIQIDQDQGQGSRFYGGNVESCTYGIYGKGSYVLVNGMRFEGNDTDVYLDKASSAWLISGGMGLDRVTNNATRNQITTSFRSNTEPFGTTSAADYLSGSVPWDPARIADSAVTSTDVNVPGALVGNPVSVGFSQPLPAGAMLSGAVSAPNVVTVTLFNKTGRPLDLGTGQLRADVRR